MKKFLFLTFLILLFSFSSNKVIWDEKLTSQELKSRVEKFNVWYKEFNPSSKVELRLNKDNELGLFALEDLKKGEDYLKIKREHTLDHNLIYDTKLGPVIKKAEQEASYSDYTNHILLLLYEMNNPQSKFKPYLDLLPRQPKTLAFNYWKIKIPVEEELAHTPVLSKINLIIYFLDKLIEYKFNAERTAKGIYQYFVKNNTDIFDPEIFNVENIEWAMLTLDQRLTFIGYETFLIPMLDFSNLKFDLEDKFSTKFNEESKTANIIVSENVKKGGEIFFSKQMNNDNALIHHMTVPENNEHNCYSISLSFSSKDDSLRGERSQYFGKYFLYDSNMRDVM